MSFDNIIDLEYGKLNLSTNMKKLSRFYKNNKKHIKNIIFLFVILTGVIISHWCVNNIDVALEKAAIVTLDEEKYTTFVLGDLNTKKIEDKSSEQLPLKTSEINMKLQTMNLKKVHEEVMDILTNYGYVCIHARHFGVKYDITFFDNCTIINPEIQKTSERKVNIDEISLDGTSEYKNRPTWVRIMYFDVNLNRKYDTLYNEQAYCFLHYNT